MADEKKLLAKKVETRCFASPQKHQSAGHREQLLLLRKTYCQKHQLPQSGQHLCQSKIIYANTARYREATGINGEQRKGDNYNQRKNVLPISSTIVGSVFRKAFQKFKAFEKLV